MSLGNHTIGYLHCMLRKPAEVGRAARRIFGFALVPTDSRQRSREVRSSATTVPSGHHGVHVCRSGTVPHKSRGQRKNVFALAFRLGQSWLNAFLQTAGFTLLTSTMHNFSQLRGKSLLVGPAVRTTYSRRFLWSLPSFLWFDMARIAPTPPRWVMIQHQNWRDARRHVR